MQRALNNHNTNSATYFGGIFSPLAQYPGASYAKILSEKIEQNTFIIPKTTKREKVLVKSNTRYLKNMTNNALPFKSALLLVDMESNASLDKAALRDAGIKHVRVLTSGLHAAKVLSAKDSVDMGEDSQIDVVFCHPRFEDMSAVQWIELIRLHESLKNLPVIALIGSPIEEKFLQHADFNDFMLRPYSPKILHDKLLNIDLAKQKRDMNIESTDFDNAICRYERCKTEEGKGLFNIEEGMRFVQQKNWDSAIQSFTKAMLSKVHKGDAELGLAAAYRGKQDVEKYRYYLYEASLTFTRTAQWSKARSAYAHVLKDVPMAPSPFVRTAQSYIRSGEYAEASATLVAGLDLSTHENIAKHVARACLYTENPPHTLQKVKQFFIDPALKDIVTALDSNLQQAFVSHENSLTKSREEQARLEEKARLFKLQKAKDAEKERAKNDVVSLVGFDEIDDISAYDAYSEDDGESILEVIPGNASLIEDDYVKKNSKTGGVLELMNEDTLESNLFTGFPKLNEAATVIKTTLKLMKK